MIYCVNPFCDQRENPDHAEHCLACDNPLVINGRFRLLRPLRSLTQDPYTYIDVFEVEDVSDSLRPQRKIMKVLKWISDAKVVELLRREYVILRTLDHPGVPKCDKEDYFKITLLDSPLVMHCLVMQKIEGDNLRDWLQTYGKISQNTALDWLKQLVNILDTVHRNEYFHRDIKPDNIILQPDGQIALIDFGGAREISRTFLAKVSTNGGTSTGSSMGYELTNIRSAYYSPLEQINGRAVPQSDFYALGRTFVHLITNIPLIDLESDDNTGQLFWRDQAPHIDPPLADLIDDLIAPFPGQRPQTTQIILQRLDKIPRQTQIHRLTKSTAFKISAIGTAVGLVALVFFKIGLPAIARGLVARGEALEKHNNSQSAQSWFQRGIAIDSSTRFSISNFYLGQAARHINDNLNQSQKYYEFALQYDPTDIKARYSLIETCRQLRDEDCVIHNYQTILKSTPHDWQAYYNFGIFYDDEGKTDTAQKLYLQALHLNQDAAPALDSLSRLRNLKGDYQQSSILALKGLNKTNNPKLKAALYKNLAWSFLKTRNYTMAQNYSQKAIELDPQRTDAACLLAMAQDALGQSTSFPNYWEICLVTSSSQPEVFTWRREFLQRLSNRPQRTGY